MSDDENDLIIIEHQYDEVAARDDLRSLTTLPVVLPSDWGEATKLVLSGGGRPAARGARLVCRRPLPRRGFDRVHAGALGRFDDRPPQQFERPTLHVRWDGERRAEIQVPGGSVFVSGMEVDSELIRIVLRSAALVE